MFVIVCFFCVYLGLEKKQNEFPVEWAYIVALKYNLLTEWLMTGRGAKNLDEFKDNSRYTFKILHDLDDWLSELVVQEPHQRFPGIAEIQL